MTVASAGAVLRSVAIVGFVAALGLHRRRIPLGDWKPELHGAQRFGNYRPLLFGAYAFLAFGALLQGGAAATLLAGYEPWLQPAGARHAFVAGFGTMLILGVAPRMIAGFFAARGPAYPRLVEPTAWLVAPAAAVITLYLAFPAQVGLPLRGLLFGVAGPMMWIAVSLLAANLWFTALRALDPPGAAD